MDVTQSDQAGPDPWNNNVLTNDETVDDESMDGEQIESDIHQIRVPFSTAQSKHSNTVSWVNCIICHEFCRYFETLKTPCDHHYCKNCLVVLVEAFTRDESLFPLRCCQDPIPVAEVLPSLSLELRSLFRQKNAEFSVHTRDRLYCSNLDCSTFLESSEGRLSVSAIECPHCLVNTCPRCKESAHPGEGCGVSALQWVKGGKYVQVATLLWNSTLDVTTWLVGAELTFAIYVPHVGRLVIVSSSTELD